MTTPTEQNFNSFKGITGIHTNTANVVRDYANMIPLGDTVVTRHGFKFDPESTDANCIYRWPSGHRYCSHGWQKMLHPSNWIPVALDRFAEDDTIYALYYCGGSSDIGFAFLGNCLVFEVTNSSHSQTYLSYVELPRDGTLPDGSSTGTLLTAGYEKAANRGSKFIRNSYNGTKDYQETYVCFAGYIFMVSKQGRVRLIPSPFVNDEVVRFWTEQGATAAETAAKMYTYLPHWLGEYHPSMSSTALDELLKYQRLFAKQMVACDYELEWMDSSLLVLDRGGNRLYYSCQDPGNYFRVDETLATIDTDYDAGTADWFDLTTGTSKLWDGSFTNPQTSDVMNYVIVNGEIGVAVCNKNSYMFKATQDSTYPYQWVTGSYIPLGGVKPIALGSNIYLFGEDAMGLPSVIQIDISGSLSTIMTTDVSRRVGTPTRMEVFKNHGMHHILFHYYDEGEVASYDSKAVAYCVDNQLWWNFKPTYPSQSYNNDNYFKCSRQYESGVYSYAKLVTYCKDGSIMAVVYDTVLNYQASLYNGSGFRVWLDSSAALERLVDDTTFATECTSETAYTDRANAPAIGEVVEYPTTNYDCVYNGGYLDYSLTELNQTFSKRAILASLSVRMDSNREYHDRSTMLSYMHGDFDIQASSRTISETVTLNVSFDRGNTFNSSKTRNLVGTSGRRNDREIQWRGLGSGNALCAKITYDSVQPTQIYAIDYSLV